MSAGTMVMNKKAIAIAADSAVPFGDHAAIHNSANKLFVLSLSEPIGAIALGTGRSAISARIAFGACGSL